MDGDCRGAFRRLAMTGMAPDFRAGPLPNPPPWPRGRELAAQLQVVGAGIGVWV